MAPKCPLKSKIISFQSLVKTRIRIRILELANYWAAIKLAFEIKSFVCIFKVTTNSFQYPILVNIKINCSLQVIF